MSRGTIYLTPSLLIQGSRKMGIHLIKEKKISYYYLNV